MGLHHPGIGEGGEHQRKGRDVRGGLEHPGRRRGPVLQHLEEAALVVVAHLVVHGRAVELADHRPVEAAEAALGDRAALHRPVGAEVVHRPQLGLDVGPQLVLALGELLG